MDAFKAIGGAVVGTGIAVFLMVTLDAQESSGSRTAEPPQAAAPGPKQPSAPAPAPQGGSDARIGLTLCNEAAERVDVSLAYREGADWLSVGWMGLPAGECKNLPVELSGKDYYVHGVGTNGGRWGGNYMFCTVHPDAFEIRGDGDCRSRGYESSGFSRIEIGPGVKHFTYKLAYGEARTIDGLDVGDGVYIRGLMSDELAEIVRIDRSKNRVKVRLAEDGTTRWVDANDVMTRAGKDEMDGKRVAAGITVVMCLLNPDACKGK